MIATVALLTTFQHRYLNLENLNINVFLLRCPSTEIQRRFLDVFLTDMILTLRQGRLKDVVLLFNVEHATMIMISILMYY